MAGPQLPPQTKLVKPKTKRGKRALEKREPKLVEDTKKALLLHGGKVSQVVQDALGSINKLKQGECVRYTRRNDDARPFEAGGEARLEHFARKSDCSLFALANHSKKRPHNIVLGRFYNHQLLDMLEFGIEQHKSIAAFRAAASAVQVGNKPCMAFAGDGFTQVPELKLAKSLLIDFFRGQQVASVNLKGFKHVILVATLDRRLHLRQYAISLKRSGTKVPRVELEEMGPRLELSLRRVQAAAPDVESLAMKQPKTSKKKEKNVSTDLLEGKVARVYVPQQNLDTIALRKTKGSKRERRSSKLEEVAAAAAGVERPAKQARSS
ncbi:hypothetical protein WJX74_004002 [Apatococcus lobatus]|uniref:Ribosome production factor 2 homolog n=1 Tax=Apatococcus lobatus TaxID=904363 RepID=A0AAW1QJI8_9CHLO